MHIMLVQIQVKPERIEDFLAETLINAENTRRETGNIRFDVLQQHDDPARFLLIEVYHQPADHEQHRQTAHYQHWRATVAEMMAADRIGTFYNLLTPPNEASLDDHAV